MHSHRRGEKLENIKRNDKVGFEVDRSLEFLPSYFFDPTDASLADTLSPKSIELPSVLIST